jgi:imidazolonepropionase
MSYREIAGAGGGIMKTVADTRHASENELVARSAGLLGEQLALGITAVECKSGYGLDLKNEVKFLRV